MTTHPTVQPLGSKLPCLAVGAGLKPEHAEDIFAGTRRVDFFEIHAENYMGAGGPPHHLLERIRADYPLSVHGVGLSIGGTAPLDRAHLMRLKFVKTTFNCSDFIGGRVVLLFYMHIVGPQLAHY